MTRSAPQWTPPQWDAQIALLRGWLSGTVRPPLWRRLWDGREWVPGGYASPPDFVGTLERAAGGADSATERARRWTDLAAAAVEAMAAVGPEGACGPDEVLASTRRGSSAAYGARSLGGALSLRAPMLTDGTARAVLVGMTQSLHLLCDLITEPLGARGAIEPAPIEGVSEARWTRVDPARATRAVVGLRGAVELCAPGFVALGWLVGEPDLLERSQLMGESLTPYAGRTIGAHSAWLQGGRWWRDFAAAEAGRTGALPNPDDPERWALADALLALDGALARARFVRNALLSRAEAPAEADRLGRLTQVVPSARRAPLEKMALRAAVRAAPEGAHATRPAAPRRM